MFAGVAGLKLRGNGLGTGRHGAILPAVYGRMFDDRPAPKITTGTGTPGQKRFIHSLRRSLIAPHEAARIQGFPDGYGYRMLHAKLVREGFRVNVKVVERLYREERLWLCRTKRKKIPREGREGAWCPIASNQRWSLDFTSDALANGRKFRTANLKDDCTRECPAIKVDLSLPGERVVHMLERVARDGVTSISLSLITAPNCTDTRLTDGPKITGGSCISSTPASGPRTPTSRISTADTVKNA